jgi:hypothetical protein
VTDASVSPASQTKLQFDEPWQLSCFTTCRPGPDGPGGPWSPLAPGPKSAPAWSRPSRPLGDLLPGASSRATPTLAGGRAKSTSLLAVRSGSPAERKLSRDRRGGPPGGKFQLAAPPRSPSRSFEIQTPRDLPPGSSSGDRRGRGAGGKKIKSPPAAPLSLSTFPPNPLRKFFLAQYRAGTPALTQRRSPFLIVIANVITADRPVGCHDSPRRHSDQQCVRQSRAFDSNGNFRWRHCALLLMAILGGADRWWYYRGLNCALAANSSRRRVGGSATIQSTARGCYNKAQALVRAQPAGLF